MSQKLADHAAPQATVPGDRFGPIDTKLDLGNPLSAKLYWVVMEGINPGITNDV